jgi:CRISPR-associated exonuclease Cas4
VSPVVLALGLVCLLAGLTLLWQTHRARERSGLPGGEIVYADTGAWRPCEGPLFSQRHRLTGRPDYIVRGHGELTPVEVKSTRGLTQPYESHVLQLMAYCLLIEEHEARRPTYGLLHYPDRTFRVPFTPSAQAQLLDVVAHVRTDLHADDVARSHSDPRRCRTCGVRSHCSQRL